MSDSLVSEAEWIANERMRVEEYLRSQGVDHLGVAEAPAFHVPPYLALWAVQSKNTPGSVGWWAISGDVPADYISSSEGRCPKEALRAIAAHWSRASEALSKGHEYAGYAIGTPAQWPELADLLQRRAAMIQEITNDETLWAGE